jgi:preprotein translocase subunit YajC
MIFELAAKGGGGGSSFLLVILLGVGALWLIVIRPQRRKQKLQQSMQTELSIGDEIITAGGVYGKVTQIDDDDVHVEIAPNVEVRLARRAIAAQLTEHEPEAADASVEPVDASDENPQAALDAESDEKRPG